MKDRTKLVIYMKVSQSQSAFMGFVFPLSKQLKQPYDFTVSFFISFFNSK